MSSRKKKPQPYLLPKRGAIRRRPYIVYDIESKDGDTQAAGFTRPFLVGSLVGSDLFGPEATGLGEYKFFDNDPRLRASKDIPWDRRHIERGGCVDRFLSWLFYELPREMMRAKREAAGEVYDGDEQDTRQIIVYAHNGGKFDHLHLIPWLEEHRSDFGFGAVEFEIIPVQSSIQEMQVWVAGEKKPRWLFRDSLKLLNMGLERACKSFGVKGKIEHDLGLPEDSPLWESYLRQDNVALYKVMERVHDLVEGRLGGEVGMTTPATSMNLFRRKYMKRKIPRHQHFPECDGFVADEIPFDFEYMTPRKECMGCCHDFFREGYYGGRTELHRLHGENLHYYDINSSYVAALCEPMPVGVRFMAEGEIDWRMRANGWIGFADVDVEIPETCDVPPLPYKHPNGKLMFPTGRFSGVWDVDELQLLEDDHVQGQILKVRRVVWIRGETIFKEMMLELYKLRDKANPDFDEGLSLLAKLLGNGFYGKFGQKLERMQIVHAQPPTVGSCFLCKSSVGPDEQVCRSCHGSKLAGHGSAEHDHGVWYRGKLVDPQYVMPQIAAHVTTLARIRLWRFMIQAIDLGGKIYYTDSVSADRPVVLRDPTGHVQILTVEEAWSKVGGEPENAIDEKERKSPETGWKALAKDSSGKEGWFSLTQVIRHRAGKTMHRISTVDGQTEVTSDHGIMVDGNETAPEDFVERACRFTKIRAPKEDVEATIDIFEHVRFFTFPSSPERRFEADDEEVYLVTAKGRLGFKRFYPVGSPERTALMRLAGAYVSDGSSSIMGLTTKTRHLLSFCKADRCLMEQIRGDLDLLAPSVRWWGPAWSDTVYIVRSGTQAMAGVFAALFGTGSRGKKLPSFMYKLDASDFEVFFAALEKGDGHWRAGGRMEYTTTSAKLAAGISYVYDQHDVEHSIGFRVEKESWSLCTRIGPARAYRKSEGRVQGLKHEVFEADPDAYVYDLSVEGAHTFVDAIGRVLLHNTDSIITDVEMPTGTELGALKDEYPEHLLRYLGVQPKVYVLEYMDGSAFSGSHLPTCLGIARKECKGCAPWKIAAKGFPPDLRTAENVAALGANLERIRKGEEPEPLSFKCSKCDNTTIHYHRLEQVRSMAARAFEGSPKMIRVDRSFKSPYDKRDVIEGGATKAVKVDFLGEEIELDLPEAAE